MINFIDFRVFKQDWLCVVASPATKEENIICNDREKLKEYYESHKDDIFCSYGIREYQQWIFRGIIAGFHAHVIHDYIVNKGEKGYTFSQTMNKYPLNIYDIAQKDMTLKQLEAFQGNSIMEPQIDGSRKLTDTELSDVAGYLENDVQEIMDLFLQLKPDFDVQMELIREFNLPLSNIGKTQTQLTAQILEAKSVKYEDDFDISFPPYLDRIKKYKKAVDWFKQHATGRKLEESDKKEIYADSLKMTVAGVTHVFKWGGLHGARAKYHGEGYYLHIDAGQYYSSIMIKQDYFSRAVSATGKRRYEMMRNESIRLKGKPELAQKRAGYKLCNNKAYGATKDKYNPLYDAKMANNICVTGQLSMLLLLEMLEDHCMLIQTNTDGIIVKLRSLEDYDKIDDICWEWEKITGIKLDFDPIITRIYQKDVNNYLCIDETGQVKSTGILKPSTALDNDLPIIKTALRNYMIDGKKVEDTIRECDELIQFQKVIKLGGQYDYIELNGKKYMNQCFRVFADDRKRYTGAIYKAKLKKNRTEKVANTPLHCFLDNGEITGVKIPEYLDKQWYVAEAKKRLEWFGLEE